MTTRSERRDLVTDQTKWAEQILRDIAVHELEGAVTKLTKAIKGPRRYATLVAMRAKAVRRLSEELKWSSTEIGQFLGGRDHTSILHHLNGHGKKRG